MSICTTLIHTTEDTRNVIANLLDYDIDIPEAYQQFMIQAQLHFIQMTMAELSEEQEIDTSENTLRFIENQHQIFDEFLNVERKATLSTK